MAKTQKVIKGSNSLNKNKKKVASKKIEKKVKDKRNMKLVFIVAGIVLVLLVLIMFLFLPKGFNTKLLTIDDTVITEGDFNIYLYSAKYNYFGKNTEDITSDDLKVVYDSDTNLTVADYLKSIALSDVKTAAAIRKMASMNNITLKDSDYEKLKSAKDEFIESLGGKDEFVRLLKDNRTTEDAYDKMAEIDALYKKIMESLYSEGTINDLTREEKLAANDSYMDEYYKIKQIILTTIDLETRNNLSTTAINQKSTLASSIVEEAKSGVDFDSLIKKYSEDSTEKEPPYDTYYRKGTLLTELEDAVKKLEVGSVSQPIRTKYAYHIILKEALDSVKLDEYYDYLREEKCINDLKDIIEDEKIIYHEAYEKLELK